MYRSHFRLHPKPVLIAHRLSCIDRTIPIDQLLLVAGLQDPSVTSTLIQQNREGLDSGEQNIDLQLHPEALLSRWVGEIHPPTPAPITKSPHPPISLLHSARWTMHQYRVLLTMCCSLTANESRLVRGTTQASYYLQLPTLQSYYHNTLVQVIRLHRWVTYLQIQRPASVFNYYSVLLSSPLQRACIYPA